MSTFGNKSLIWWDYHTHDRAALLRFNSTPKDIQLQILEKWYPIGMKVGLVAFFYKTEPYYNYEIVEYIEKLNFWNVKVSLKSEGSLLNNMIYERNPLSLYPSPDWEKHIKRQSKLDRLL